MEARFLVGSPFWVLDCSIVVFFFADWLSLLLPSLLPPLCHISPFRVLVALDRFSSAALGRPTAIQDEE